MAITTTSTGSSFSSLGVGLNGSVDVNALIDAQVNVAKLAITRTNGLNDQVTMTKAKISTYGQIQSLVATLSDAASKLSSVTGWNAVTATSSNTSAVTVSAIGGTVASSFDVQIQSLAKAQNTTSTALSPSGLPVGAGTLHLDVGQWNADGTAFTPKDGTSGVDISVGASDTLASIASKINGAKAGVTATILSDGSGGERLVLRSAQTGAQQGFQLTAVDADGNNTDAAGLSRLVAGATTTYASDAKATVNGIDVTSSSNTFTNTVAGVTFTALQTTTDPVQIDVAQDTSALSKNINDFVTAYNAVNQALNQITSYDKDTQTAGLLQGDSTAVNLQNALRTALQSVASGSAAGGSLRTLSDVGISVAGGLGNLNPTGDLSVDTDKLNKALQDPDALKTFFRGGADGSVTDGVGGKISSVLSGLLSSTGFFQRKTDTLNAELKRENTDIQTVNDRADALKASLQARYTALDSQMATLNALNSYIQQQVTTWNKSSS
jgi:flagellar hook-associated protein 2